MINGGALNAAQLDGDAGVLVTPSETATLTIALELTVQAPPTVTLLIQTELKVVEPVTITIATAFTVRATMVAQVLTSFNVVKPSETVDLTIPLALSVFGGTVFTVPLTLHVGQPRVSLSIPTRLSVYQALQLSVATSFTVYPAYTGPTGGQGLGKVDQLPTGQSQTWRLEVLLDGVDVSHRLIQTASIDAEKNAAIVGVFRLRPEDGYVNPYQWVHAPVTITYMEGDYGVVLFKGVVDTPIYDVSSRIVEFTCTDDLQNLTARLGRTAVDSLTPKSLWSKYAYEEQVDSWDYLQQRLETYPYIIGLDVNRNYEVGEWGTGAISLEFTEETIIDESLSVSFANTRDITNTVNISLGYQYTQYRETVLQLDWRDDHWYRGKPLSWLFCEAQMICDAVAGSGGAFIKPPKFNMLPKSQSKHILPDTGTAYNTVFLNTGQNLLVAEFSGTIAKRYGQSVTDNTQLTVTNPKGVEALGVLAEDLETGMQAEYNPLYEQSFTETVQESKWFCTAGSGLSEGFDSPANHYSDPLLFVGAGWIHYPKKQITYTRYSQVDYLGLPLEGRNFTVIPASPGQLQVAYDLNSPKVGLSSDPGEHIYNLDSFIIQGGKADKSSLLEVLKAQARVKILESHRQNRVAFKTFIHPHIKRGQTLRVATDTMYATGPIYQYLHEFDFDQGEALTSITLALSSSQGVGVPDAGVQTVRFTLATALTVTDDPSKVPGAQLIVDVGTIQYGNDLPCHYHDGTLNPGWIGHITPANQFRVPGPNMYAVEFPTLPTANTDNAVHTNPLDGITVVVPEDELLLYA